ncbi:hypothetical protein ACS0TY_008666 [Phlomoides rotata]
MRNMHDLVMVSYDDCKDQLRMDRASFHKLCGLVRTFGGLKSSRNISVEEKVAMFLSILAHHTENRCVKFRFKRSGLQDMFLVPAQSVDENTSDPRWAKFQVNVAFILNGVEHLERYNFIYELFVVKLTCFGDPIHTYGNNLMSVQYLFYIMDAHGTTVAPNVDKGKVVRARRSWSKFEEDALIHCLTDIVNGGWKTEKGFKAGFQRELEKKMCKMLPGTDIIAHPHINSKIHVWKKEYGALSDLLSKSGIGWNSSTSMIEVADEEVWDSSRQVNVRFKSWSYYPQWLDIFGKDRATGESAVDQIDLFQELMRIDLDQAGETGDKYVPRTTDLLNEVDDNSICKPSDDGKRSSSKGKKRKSGDADLSTLVDSLGEFMKFSKEAMIREAVNTTKPEAQQDSGSNNVQIKLIESLKGINGLKVSYKLKVCEEMVQNPLRLDLFLSLLPD